MLSKILSAAHFGLETIPVEVEVNISKKGFPGFNIIGLPNKAIEEAKERVKTALVNSGIEFPIAKIVVNLAPADLANNILNKKSSIENKNLETKPNPNPVEKQIYQLLEREPLTIDEIARKTNQDIIKTGEILTFIVLKGLISEKDGKFFLN